MRALWIFAMLLAMLTAALGQGADEFYVRIYNTIQEADTLAANLQYKPALDKYKEARTALDRFQKGNRDWNASIVRFRLAYLDERIAQLSEKVPAAEAPAQPANAPTQPGNPAVGPALEAQVGVLQDQIRLLQADRSKLEAKLKEALSVQPAAIDPRELQKAEQRIQALQKENELLKVNLEQAKARKPEPAAPAADAVAEVNRKLEAQTKRVQQLELEKKALQDKLQSAAAPAEVRDSDTQLALAERNLGEQKEIIQKLSAEREALLTRLKAASLDSESAAALKAENALLKKQLAAAEAKTPVQATSPTELQARLATLQSDNEILQLEKKALQARIQNLESATNITAPAPLQANQAPTRAETKRIRELEQERDSLMSKLNAANRQLSERKRGGKEQDLEQQVLDLRQKLAVYEMQKLPYTSEELALFRAPEATLAPPQAPSSGNAPKFSASTAALAADARRDFAAGKLDQAEEKLAKAVRQDKTDVVTLSDLAAVQIERKEYGEAEKNISRALEIAPTDAFTLGLVGRLRFQQKRYDEALEALTRAAAADPSNAEVQNYLGLVLSEKGMRGPAESALRRAIQLRPNYGDAHQNLAVVYLTQNPPLAELARYHYGKSLAAGSKPNPQLESLIESKKGRR